MSQRIARRWPASAPRDPALKPVFEQFGGKPGLVALMDDFMVNLMADPRTRPYLRRHRPRAHQEANWSTSSA